MAVEGPATATVAICCQASGAPPGTSCPQGAGAVRLAERFSCYRGRSPRPPRPPAGRGRRSPSALVRAAPGAGVHFAEAGRAGASSARPLSSPEAALVGSLPVSARADPAGCGHAPGSSKGRRGVLTQRALRMRSGAVRKRNGRAAARPGDRGSWTRFLSQSNSRIRSGRAAVRPALPSCAAGGGGSSPRKPEPAASPCCGCGAPWPCACAPGAAPCGATCCSESSASAPPAMGVAPD